LTKEEGEKRRKKWIKSLNTLFVMKYKYLQYDADFEKTFNKIDKTKAFDSKYETSAFEIEL